MSATLVYAVLTVLGILGVSTLIAKYTLVRSYIATNVHTTLLFTAFAYLYILMASLT